jgi:proteasome lid subunit RPN8/RPN11
MKVRLDN